VPAITLLLPGPARQPCGRAGNPGAANPRFPNRGGIAPGRFAVPRAEGAGGPGGTAADHIWRPALRMVEVMGSARYWSGVCFDPSMYTSAGIPACSLRSPASRSESESARIITL
jgi:hypothetical protein